MKLKIIKTEKRYQKCLNWSNNSKNKKSKKLKIVLLLLDDYENKKKIISNPSLSILFPDMTNMKSACQTILNGINSLNIQYKFFTKDDEFEIKELCEKWINGFDNHKKDVIEKITVEVLSDKTIGKPIAPESQIINEYC